MQDFCGHFGEIIPNKKMLGSFFSKYSKCLVSCTQKILGNTEKNFKKIFKILEIFVKNKKKLFRVGNKFQITLEES